MNISKTASVLVLSTLMLGTTVSAFAQHDDHNGGNNHPQQQDNHGGGNQHFVKHNDWHKGARINNGDWGRGEQVDYRSHHLSAPPRGYEWRQVDGNYVMAAVATGIIASVIVASASH
jgi:Ni/Co efflux regulator RcnB